MRRKIPVLGAILLLLAVLTAGCGVKQKSRYTASFLTLFDTVTSIVGYAENEEAFTREVNRIHDELEAYDHLYNIYREYPGTVNLRTVNLHPGEILKVDRRIIDLLVFAREADLFSGHRVDAMLGSVLSLWHEAREEGIQNPAEAYLPDENTLREAQKHTGFDLIEIDEENCTVRLLDAQAQLDVGALAKGYAVQRICENIPEGYLISVGGNVVSTGPKPDGTAWTVGVQDPEGDGQTYLHKLSLFKGAVVTSGDYQRLYYVNGSAYHHIIDPETLYPGTKWRAVTVITEDSGIGDALSTALFLMDQGEGIRLLEKYGAEAVWIQKDGKQLFSPGYTSCMKP